MYMWKITIALFWSKSSPEFTVPSAISCPLGLFQLEQLFSLFSLWPWQFWICLLSLCRITFKVVIFKNCSSLIRILLSLSLSLSPPFFSLFSLPCSLPLIKLPSHVLKKKKERISKECSCVFLCIVSVFNVSFLVILALITWLKRFLN